MYFVQHNKSSLMMKRILVLILMFWTVLAGAQESALYRITFDCNAQYGPTRQVYRWHLDVGATSAVFYSPNNRAKNLFLDDVMNESDVTAVMTKLNSIKTRFPNANPLEVMMYAASGSKYTYLNEVIGDRLWYEEDRPALEWETTEKDSTVCGYHCFQAKARMYGRDWTVWFAPEIPLSYGPYVLGGLPGLILDAEDADGLFHFTAVGLEQNPAEAVIALKGVQKAVKCTRKKYLSMRDKANGQTFNERLREMGVADRAIVRVISADGKEIDLDSGRPKQNYLDLE